MKPIIGHRLLNCVPTMILGLKNFTSHINYIVHLKWETEILLSIITRRVGNSGTSKMSLKVETMVSVAYMFVGILYGDWASKAPASQQLAHFMSPYKILRNDRKPCYCGIDNLSYGRPIVPFICISCCYFSYI